MTICQARISASKNTLRINASDASSLNTPLPATLARITPAPCRSSRQRPADFGIGDVDRIGVERKPARAQPGDRDEIAGSIIELQEEVFAFLCGHEGASG